MKKTCTKSRRVWSRVRKNRKNLPEANFPTMLERISYRGWNHAYRLSNGVVELVVTADVGPRILFYAFATGKTCTMKSRKMRGRPEVPSSAFMVATACGCPRKWR